MVVVVVVAVLVILKPVLLLLLLLLFFLLLLLIFFLFLLLLLLLLSLSSSSLLLLLLLCHWFCRCCCCFCYYPNIAVELQESSRVCSSEVQKSGGLRGREKAAKFAVQKKRGRGGGGRRPPLFANLPKMTLFSSLLPPKAISCGFSILCVGEEAFTHLFVLQRLSFALLCLLAFLLHPEAFSSGFLSVGEDVFIHFFTA